MDEPLPQIIALIVGQTRSIAAIVADAEMLGPDLEKLVDEVSWGPFDDGGEPA